MENGKGDESDEARVSCHPETDLGFVVKRKIIAMLHSLNVDMCD